MRVLGWLVAACYALAGHASSAELLGPAEGCVVVSGASGFVAGHVIKLLLEAGYTVHGTVRDKSDTGKVKHLRDIEKYSPGVLKLFNATLDRANAFDEAAEGCWGFLHLAAVVSVKDETPEERVMYAVNGTEAALEAARKAGHKAVIVTSTSYTISPNTGPFARGEPSSESDWNDVARLDYGEYAFSKVQAERNALAWLEANQHPFRFATIHFHLGLGPQLERRITTSNAAVAVPLTGAIPFALPLQYTIVDIRDVARAHVVALQDTRARGRYLVATPAQSSAKSMREVNELLATRYPTFPVPLVEMPIWLARIVSKFERRFDKMDLDAAAALGRNPGFDGTKIVRELDFEYLYRDVDQTIIDTAESMISLGIVDGRRHLQEEFYALGGVAMLLAMGLIWALRMSLRKCARQPKAKEA